MRNLDWNNDITLWSKDVANSPKENAYAHYTLGLAYENESKSDLALKHYQKAFDINPNFVVAFASKGVVYANMGETEKAIEIYKEAVLKSPYFWESHNNLGILYLARGEKELAEGEFRQTVAMNPNFAPARIQLENIMSEKIGTPSAEKQGYWLDYTFGDVFSFKYPAGWTIEPHPNPLLKGEGAGISSPLRGEGASVSPSPSRERAGVRGQARLAAKRARMTDSDKILTLTSDTNTFTIEFYTGEKSSNISPVDYAKRSPRSYGKLVNQGLANVPGMDFAFVRVWDPELAEGEAKPKLQFFLFKGERVVEIAVFPGDSPFMKQLDGILASISL